MHFDHGADIGVRGIGDTREKAFEQAGLGLTAVITEPELIEKKKSVLIICSAPDYEILLNEWLNAIIYEISVQKMLFGEYQVTLDGPYLKGLAWGENIDLVRHRPIVEVKGATMTELKVFRHFSGKWISQCVVDV